MQRSSRFPPRMSCRLALHFLALAAVLVTGPLAAADLPNDVLVRTRWTELTKADVDAALSRVPSKMRFEFASSPKRVQALLYNLLVTKTLAAQARAHGTPPASSFPPGVGSDEERALAFAELARIETDAAKVFDAGKADFEVKARELYDIDRDKYRTPEEVRLSDIAVSIKERGEDGALARAKEARARIVAGADFAAVAREYSDDPTTRDKGGALPFVSRDRLARSYANAVFALTRVGEVSEPIRAPSAWHVVRVEERRPSRPQTFEEARDTIMQALRKRYIAEQREARVKAIEGDREMEVNQPAVDALVTRIDPRLMNPPEAQIKPGRKAESAEKAEPSTNAGPTPK
jgi:peptidyl-prolyl cis-trans isomerase C